MGKLTRGHEVLRVGIIGFVGIVLALAALPARAAPEPPRTPATTPAADRNWVALNIFDSIYPMTGEESLPEALGSLETIFDLYTQRDVGRKILGFFGGLKHDRYGSRSNMGHYLIWVHLSDRYLKNNPLDRKEFGEGRFMFKDRETDIFSAWSGDVNLVALLTQGIRGLAVPLPSTEPGKPFKGRFQDWQDIVPLGDADYEGGWYMSDEQAGKLIGTFQTYGGIEKGYTFMRPIEEKPNPPYEPDGAQLVNGFNCGDFAFYALTTAGVVSKDEVEALKIRFWYPRYYFQRPLPLAGAGESGADWIDKHPGATELPGNVMIQLGWAELLFGKTGLEFFNKKQLVDELRTYQYRLLPARIWDQAHVITWLRAHNDFAAKGILTELYPATLAGTRITSPERTIPASPRNRFNLTESFARMQRHGQRFKARKLQAAGISGAAGAEFGAFYETLKDHLGTR